MTVIPLALEAGEFSSRLAGETQPDCYEALSQNRRRDCYYASMRGSRFHLYYRAAGSRNLFRTYLRGKLVRRGGRPCLVYRYGTESVALIRSLIMAATFLYAAYLLRTAAPPFAVLFSLLTAACLLALLIHTPREKQRLRSKLDELLSGETTV